MSTSIVEAAFLKAVKENLCNNTRDARLAFEIAWESRGAEIVQIASDALQVMAFDEQKLSEAQAQMAIKDADIKRLAISEVDLEQKVHVLEAQIAMQVEALNECRAFIKCEEIPSREVLLAIDRALSATAETVAAWRAKETEPLRREVAMLRKGFYDFYNRVQIAEGDYAIGLALSAADEFLSGRQATALAYEREVENRGAVKALENLLEQAVEVDTLTAST